MSSKREAALVDLHRRLAFISVTKGYQTDVGEHIFLGEVPKLGPDDPPALTIMVGSDSPTARGGQIHSRVPIEILAVVPADMAAPLLTLELLIADVRRAVEIEATPSVDRFLGRIGDDGKPYGTLPQGLERGSVRPLPREQGSTFVGVAIEYVATFVEGWGQP